MRVATMLTRFQLLTILSVDRSPETFNTPFICFAILKGLILCLSYVTSALNFFLLISSGFSNAVSRVSSRSGAIFANIPHKAMGSVVPVSRKRKI